MSLPNYSSLEQQNLLLQLFDILKKHEDILIWDIDENYLGIDWIKTYFNDIILNRL